jgi:hypothetical protein
MERERKFNLKREEKIIPINLKRGGATPILRVVQHNMNLSLVEFLTIDENFGVFCIILEYLLIPQIT